MKHMVICLFSLFSFSALAQLPSNPWATQSPVQDRLNNSIVTTRESEAVRVRQGIGDSPGERDQYKIDRTQFTGEATTWGEAQGQEMIAPEVNTSNILLMTNHLRKVGYQIPAEYDDYIKEAPTWYKEKYLSALQELNSATMDKDPITGIAQNFRKFIEEKTGVSLENFVNTSFNVIEGK